MCLRQFKTVYTLIFQLDDPWDSLTGTCPMLYMAIQHLCAANVIFSARKWQVINCHKNVNNVWLPLPAVQYSVIWTKMIYTTPHYLNSISSVLILSIVSRANTHTQSSYIVCVHSIDACICVCFPNWFREKKDNVKTCMEYQLIITII